ncbi:hypothetical protein ACWDR3_18360 [Streptomyces sp. NPDC001002]
MTFAPLPGRPHGHLATFHPQLAELARLADVELPVPMSYEREWGRQARTALRNALRAAETLPEQLFDPLIRTAVLDPDPSHNRMFVEPAIVAFGRRRVLTALIAYLRTGTNPERAGAALAWYWAWAPVRRHAGQETVPAAELRADPDALADLSAEWREAALREFTANEDLDVRRCILPLLSLVPARYPADLHDLVAEAVHIARTHPDEYLRHRVEIQVRD